MPSRLQQQQLEGTQAMCSGLQAPLSGSSTLLAYSSLCFDQVLTPYQLAKMELTSYPYSINLQAVCDVIAQQAEQHFQVNLGLSSQHMRTCLQSIWPVLARNCCPARLFAFHKH